MNRNKTSLICIFTCLLMFCLCIISMFSCAKNDPSVEVMKKKRISGHTLAVCKFPDETIRLTYKTKEGYEPFFTMYEIDTKDLPIEQVKIQSGYTALEHDLFRVMFYNKALDEYNTAFFYFDEEGKPVGIALCKGQFFLADLDDDNDNEIVTTWRSDIENIQNTLVYDWQDDRVVVSNVIENARRAYNVPDEALISVGVELPASAGEGYPDANIFPEYGAYMSFPFYYYTPSDNIMHSGLHVWFRDIKDFKPFESINTDI